MQSPTHAWQVVVALAVRAGWRLAPADNCYCSPDDNATISAQAALCDRDRLWALGWLWHKLRQGRAIARWRGPHRFSFPASIYQEHALLWVVDGLIADGRTRTRLPCTSDGVPGFRPCSETSAAAVCEALAAIGWVRVGRALVSPAGVTVALSELETRETVEQRLSASLAKVLTVDESPGVHADLLSLVGVLGCVDSLSVETEPADLLAFPRPTADVDP